MQMFSYGMAYIIGHKCFRCDIFLRLYNIRSNIFITHYLQHDNVFRLEGGQSKNCMTHIFTK